MSALRIWLTVGILAASVIIQNKEEIKNQIRNLIEWIKKKFSKNYEYAEVNVHDVEGHGIEAFYCPISHEIMTDPVITPYGHCFERIFIEDWLDKKEICPLTMNSLKKSDLRPCYTLKHAIQQYKLLMSL